MLTLLLANELSKLNAWLVLVHVKCLYASVKVHSSLLLLNIHLFELSTVLLLLLFILCIYCVSSDSVFFYIYVYLAQLTLDQYHKVGHQCLFLRF